MTTSDRSSPPWPFVGGLALVVALGAATAWRLATASPAGPPSRHDRATATVATEPAGAARAPRAPQPSPTSSPASAGQAASGPDRAPGARAAAATPQAPPRSALERAFEHDDHDPGATEAEATIEAAFRAQPGFEQIFRGAMCTRRTCRMFLRWNEQLSPAYNAALVELVNLFSKELSLEPDPAAPAEPGTIAVAAFIARRGHSTEEIMKDLGGDG